jgi:hypothetical protein
MFWMAVKINYIIKNYFNKFNEFIINFQRGVISVMSNWFGKKGRGFIMVKIFKLFK